MESFLKFTQGRGGPFATRTTAYERLRQAQDQWSLVSSGVFGDGEVGQMLQDVTVELNIAFRIGQAVAFEDGTIEIIRAVVGNPNLTIRVLVDNRFWRKIDSGNRVFAINGVPYRGLPTETTRAGGILRRYSCLMTRGSTLPVSSTPRSGF